MIAQKVFLVLVLLFIGQLVASCGDECTCPRSATYEVLYQEVRATPYNTTGFVEQVITADTVPKNAFGLEVKVVSLQEQISQRIEDHPIAFGFNYALACDCVGDEYTYPDPLDSIATLRSS